MSLLQERTTSQLREEIENFRTRAENPFPWEDPKELAFQAGIRQEVLNARGVS